MAFGAFFPTTTKITSSRATPELLRQSAALGVPRVAIGGLTPDNVGPLLDAGADLLAVVSGIFAADDPVATQRAFLAQFPHQDTP
ncbi:Thiamine-phosphate synthase [compost metagenome]